MYNNANQAFEDLYNLISKNGIQFNNTLCLFNYGFYIKNPIDNNITSEFRKWNKEYAEFEWQWYLSGNPSGIEISKKAKIWSKCLDQNGCVNSNYGYQWNRGNQYEYIINELKNNKYSRRASISIYDAKDRHNFEKDTPCTYAINFYILNDRLNISVLMRSNDLWYGFCNDQYCFSRLQEKVSNELNIEIGTYYHFANNLHIYNNFLNKKP